MSRRAQYSGRGRRRRRRSRAPIYLISAAVFLFAAGRIVMGFLSDGRNQRDNDALRQEAVSAVEPVAVEASPMPETAKSAGARAEPAASASPSPTPTAAPEPTRSTAPVTADFKKLKATNKDIVAWLYCADSHIDYPVVYGEDNVYYLTHNANRTETDNGALFIDSRSEGDFSEAVTVIYGHNMETQKMFGSLNSYDTQDYYEAHPVMYLLTPDKDYQLDVVCSFYTTVDSPAFVFPCTEGSYGLLRKDIELYSYIDSLTALTEGEQLVCLSTCGNSENERFLVIAALRALG